MDRLVAALNRRQRREVELLEGAKDDGHQQQQHGIEVELRCIRPFDSDCVAFLDGFLYGNTNFISSLNVALCELSSRPQSQGHNDDDNDCEHEDRVVSRSTATTALDVICRFLACPRVRHTCSNSNSIALKSITFMACHLTNENARRIVQALHFGNRGHHTDHQTTITQLDLSRNELHGVDGGVILGEFLTLLSSQLTHFNISRNPGLGPDAMAQSNLRQGLNKCKKLVKLSVHGCKIGNVGLSQLCLALDIHDAMPVEEFDIGENDLQGSMAGVCLAFIVQHMTRLRTLDVSCNPQLGADGILALGKAVVTHDRRHEFLQTLSISDCGIGNTGVEVLDQALKVSLIRRNNNHVVGGIYKSLTTLHIARNNICNGAALGSLLQPFGGLQRCTLSSNPLGLNGAADLGPVVVQFCHSLQHLQMTNCRLGNVGIDYMITQVYAKSPSLQTIQLGSNHDAVAFLSPNTMLPLAFMGNGHVHQSYQQHPALCYQDATQQQPEKCAACQGHYRENADIEKLPCGRHYLHSSCLHSWRNSNSRECPFRHDDDKVEEEPATVSASAKAHGALNVLGQAMQVSAVTGQEEMVEQEDEGEAMAVEEEEHTTIGAVGPSTVLAPKTTAVAALHRQQEEEWHSADEDDDGDEEEPNKSSTTNTAAALAVRNNTAHTQRPAGRNDDDDNEEDDDDDDESTEVVAATDTQYKTGNEFEAAARGEGEEY